MQSGPQQATQHFQFQVTTNELEPLELSRPGASLLSTSSSLNTPPMLRAQGDNLASTMFQYSPEMEGAKTLSLRAAG